MRRPEALSILGRAAAAGLLGTCLFTGPARAVARHSAGQEPAAQKKTLAGGLTLISEKDETTATTVLQILVKGGKRAEPVGREGLAFLATRLAVEIPDEDKIQDLVGMASRFQVSVRGDFSVIQVECLSAQLEPTLKILSKIVGDPLFSGLRIDAVKRYAEHQGRIEEDDSVTLGHLTALRAFSGGPGYGGSIYGDKKTLDAIKGRDISDFYKRYFSSPNMLLIVSSDRPDAAAVVEGAFRELPAAAAPPLEKAVLRVPENREMFLTRETKQTYVSQAFLLPALGRRSFVLGQLLENLLGKGPGSRLWPLRTEKKLAYNVNAVATQMVDGGLLEAYLETDRNKEKEALEALKAATSELWQTGVSEDDLRSARVSVWADFLRDNEPAPARTLSLVSFEAQGLGLDFYYGLRSELDAVSVEEMNGFIKGVLAPENAVLVVIGPKKSPPPAQSSSF